jgi:hypothetical protein
VSDWHHCIIVIVIFLYVTFVVINSIQFSSLSLCAGVGFNCVRFLGTAVAVILSLFGFLSPIAMVVLPRLDVIDWATRPDGTSVDVTSMKTCAPECEGLLISFAFKLLILMLGTLAVFFRQPKVMLHYSRCVYLAFVFLRFSLLVMHDNSLLTALR